METREKVTVKFKMEPREKRAAPNISHSPSILANRNLNQLSLSNHLRIKRDIDKTVSFHNLSLIEQIYDL